MRHGVEIFSIYFKVGVDLQTPNEQFWSKKYHLKREFIPTFVTQNQAEKILLIGKSINFLREVCNQSNCEIKSKKIPYEGGEGLDREVVHRLQGKNKGVAYLENGQFIFYLIFSLILHVK